MPAWLPFVLGAAGKAIGAAAERKAKNRAAKFEGQTELERLLLERDREYFNQTLAREQEGRLSGSDAWRKLIASQRLLEPGPRPQISPYAAAPRTLTPADYQGLTSMTNEALVRTQGGNPIAPITPRPSVVDPRLLDPGKFERVAAWLAPILGYSGSMTAQTKVGK